MTYRCHQPCCCCHPTYLYQLHLPSWRGKPLLAESFGKLPLSATNINPVAIWPSFETLPLSAPKPLCSRRPTADIAGAQGGSDQMSDQYQWQILAWADGFVNQDTQYEDVNQPPNGTRTSDVRPPLIAKADLATNTEFDLQHNTTQPFGCASCTTEKLHCLSKAVGHLASNVQQAANAPATPVHVLHGHPTKQVLNPTNTF